MNRNIDKILVFKLYGKYAHFRKFYTNSSSSLTYFIPPRTTITGILASIMEMPRNEYYEIFSVNNCSIALAINSPLKKYTECMNYLHQNWEKTGSHTQCRLEILTGINNSIEYIIYFNHIDKTIFNEIKNKIIAQKLGYGVYLGQRQFKGNIFFIKEIKDIEYLKTFNKLHSIINKKNLVKINTKTENINVDIITNQIPINMLKLSDGTRIKKEIQEIIFEKNGNELVGKFKNGYRLPDNRIISFFEG